MSPSGRPLVESKILENAPRNTTLTGGSCSVLRILFLRLHSYGRPINYNCSALLNFCLSLAAALIGRDNRNLFASLSLRRPLGAKYTNKQTLPPTEARKRTDCLSWSHSYSYSPPSVGPLQIEGNLSCLLSYRSCWLLLLFNEPDTNEA